MRHWYISSLVKVAKLFLFNDDKDAKRNKAYSRGNLDWTSLVI